MGSRFLNSTQRLDGREVWRRRSSMRMKKDFMRRSHSENGRLKSQASMKDIPPTSISSGFRNSQSKPRCDKRHAADELETRKRKAVKIEGMSNVDVSREVVDTMESSETTNTPGQGKQNGVRNMKWMERGSAPSRVPNECYNGGSSDSLWNEGRGIVPDGLKKAAQKSEGGERDGDAWDNGDKSDESSYGEEANGSAYGEEEAEGFEGVMFRPAEREEYEEGQWGIVPAKQNGRVDEALLESESEEEHVGRRPDTYDARELEAAENTRVSFAREDTDTGSYHPNTFGTAPSRSRIEHYRGDTTDALFDGTVRTEGPMGLRGPAGSGGDEGDRDENSNETGHGSGDSRGGGNGSDGQDTPEQEDVVNNYEEFDPLNWTLDGLIDIPYSYEMHNTGGGDLESLQSTAQHSGRNNQPELCLALSLPPRNASTAEERELLENPWS